jgi:hypothetical protein
MVKLRCNESFVYQVWWLDNEISDKYHFDIPLDVSNQTPVIIVVCEDHQYEKYKHLKTHQLNNRANIYGKNWILNTDF